MSQKPANYYCTANPHMLRAALNQTSMVQAIDVGCGTGALGAAIKANSPYTSVYGIEIDPKSALAAAEVLDHVYLEDVQTFKLPLEPGSVDVFLYGDVLEHLTNPGAVLASHKRYLDTYGKVLCSIPNVYHYSIVERLLRGSWQYEPAGILDSTHLRFFTFADVVKMLLDAGLYIDRIDRVTLIDSRDLLERVHLAVKCFRGDHAEARSELETYQWLVEASPSLRRNVSSKLKPITFVACVSNERVLKDNLLSSPCLQSGSPHEVLLYRGMPNAAEGLNTGLCAARNSLIVFVHQDVYLPQGWDDRLSQELSLAEDFAVAGCWGASPNGVDNRQEFGSIFDRHHCLHCVQSNMPTAVQTLDEALLVLPKPTSLRFNPELGFHLYGADICMQAHEQGGRVVAMNNCCFHNSQNDGLPKSYELSAAVFEQTWANRLPIATPCRNFLVSK